MLCISSFKDREWRQLWCPELAVSLTLSLHTFFGKKSKVAATGKEQGHGCTLYDYVIMRLS